jgi:hypothetical protein
MADRPSATYPRRLGLFAASANCPSFGLPSGGRLLCTAIWSRRVTTTILAPPKLGQGKDPKTNHLIERLTVQKSRTYFVDATDKPRLGERLTRFFRTLDSRPLLLDG